MTAHALTAADILAAKGHSVEVIHVHTIKPLDEALILRRAAAADSVFTLEEHTVIGGLGSAVVDLLIEQGPVRQIIKKLGLTDSFVKNYGIQDDLLEINGLMPPQIAAAVEKTLAACRSGQLAPTFRSSCSIVAPASTNFGKLWALANSLILVPLFYLKFLDRICRLWCWNFK